VIESRSEARANGRKHYFTGKPCPWGHVALRTVSTGNCLVCGQDRSQVQRDEQRRRIGAIPRGREREHAQAEGLKRYSTGKPCSHGHIAERSVSSRRCVVCAHAQISSRRSTAEGRHNEYAQEKERRDRTGSGRIAARKYYHANREHCISRQKAWRDNNLKDWQTNKYRNEPNFRLARILRARLYGAIKGNARRKRIGSFVSDLGCSIDFLRSRIEEQFSYGMTWDNHGVEWELDHRQPLCSFDLTDREQFLRAAHYTNLQPLWLRDHHAKRSSDMQMRKRVGS
jgi:hypothetical protein